MEYIGNCIDSFDEDGDCISDFLPWRDTTDFAQADEEENRTPVAPFKTLQKIADPDYYIIDNIHVAYDPDDDVHYFYL